MLPVFQKVFLLCSICPAIWNSKANSILYFIPGRLHYNHNQTFIHLLLSTELPNGKHAPAHRVPCSREPKAPCVPTGPNACSSYDMILIDTSTREVSSQKAESQSRNTMTASPVPQSSLRNNARSEKSTRYRSAAVLLFLSPSVRGAQARAPPPSASAALSDRESLFITPQHIADVLARRGEKEREGTLEGEKRRDKKEKGGCEKRKRRGIKRERVHWKAHNERDRG